MICLHSYADPRRCWLQILIHAQHVLRQSLWHQCPLLSAHAAGGGGGQTTRSSGFRHRGGLGATGRRRRPSRWRAAAAGRAAAPPKASLACIGTTTGGGRGEITAAGLLAGAHLHQIRPYAVCAEHQTDGNCSRAHTNEIPVQEGEAC